MSNKDGGCAFPNDGQWANGRSEGGMSLRDWFAGKVVTGLIACNGRTSTNEVLAKGAYEIADAMIAERAKEKP